MKRKAISLIAVVCMAVTMFALPVSAADTTYEDIDAGRFEQDINYVFEEGIFENGDIEGDATEWAQGVVTRGEYAIWLARLEGVDFDAYVVQADDVLADMAAYETTNEELYKAVAWGKDNGYINGYKDGEYKPAKEISREEICALIARYYMDGRMNQLQETDNIVFFPDTEEFSDYSKDYVEFCVKYGLIQGKEDGTFGAHDKGTTRQQMAAIIHRADNNDEVAATTTKFFFEIASGDGFVSARVNEAYVMELTVADECIDASNVKLTAEMTNVASLGVAGETRSHTIEVTTDMEGNGDLDVWLSECFNFTGAKANVLVGDKECVYNVSATTIDEDGNAVILFVPENTPATRAAWQELTSHVSTETKGEDDSYVLIARDSYLVLGEDKLEFEAAADDLKLDNFNNISALKQEIRDAVTLKEQAVTEPTVEGYLASGTQLRVGSSVATLDDGVTVTIEGMENVTAVNSILTDLRDAESTYAMAEKLVKGVNALVGALDGQEVDIIVAFDAE